MLLPVKFRPKESYHEPPRSFGARRDHGHRKHAGCDLYAPIGTPVIAVADGKVLAVYKFYLGSWAIEVDHGAFLVRYGEVTPKILVKPGDAVKRGQLVGHVGLLVGLHVSMLHFEMYDGSEAGPLTNRKNPPFMRRADLIDPTAYMDAADLDAGGKAWSLSGPPLFPKYRADLLPKSAGSAA